MPQSTTFPLRYGLQLPAPENLKSIEVFSEGGLDLTQSVIEARPGCASQLVNFEASLTGGYRRIDGFSKYSITIVPGQGPILGVAVFWPSTIIAARQDAVDASKYNIYYSSGQAWTQINPTTQITTGNVSNTSKTITNIPSTVVSGLLPGQPVTGAGITTGAYIVTIASSTSITISIAATATTSGVTLTFSNPLSWQSGMIVNSCFYNWSGVVRITFFDGVNYAYKWDGTTMTVLTGTVASPAPSNPTFGCEFEGYLVVGGFSSNYGAIAWCAPLSDIDWVPADGAAEVVIGDTTTWLKEWRQQLIIFSKNSIHRMVPNSLNITGVSPPPPFQIQPITDRIGCFEGRTVKEINGDLVFLAPDGIRTISGTFNIGDTEIGSISRPIQSIVSSINPNQTPCHSLVIHKKTQYRLFYPSTGPASQSFGIMGSVRRFRDGHEGWEWGQIQGIQPSCCDSQYLADGKEYPVHGGLDGYVYLEEQGNTFNGSPINEIYTTVPLELGDIGLRKAIQRITIYVTTVNEAANLNLKVIYDFNKTGTIQPPSYPLANLGTGSVLFDTDVKYDTGAVYDNAGIPIYRQNVQGSGFIAQIGVNSLLVPGTTLYDRGILYNSGAKYGFSSSNPSYVIQGFYVEFFPGARR